jgi:predicted nucleic acid-binding protein
MAVSIDTCIIIDYLRDNSSINLSREDILINPVVELEILQGVRNKREQKNALRTMEYFQRIEYSTECFNLAKILILRYSLSHSLKLPDALIAASCLIYDLPLWTHNVKDFAYIEGMKIYQQGNSND